MNGSTPAAAVWLASPVSPEALPARMAAASRVLFGASARACAAEPAAAVGATLPSVAGGSTGAATRGTTAVSDAGADATGATVRTGGLPASEAFGSQVLLRSG